MRQRHSGCFKFPVPAGLTVIPLSKRPPETSVRSPVPTPKAGFRRRPISLRNRVQDTGGPTRYEMWQCFPWHIGFARLERIAQALRRLRKCLQIVHDRICAMRERKNASLPSLVYARIKSMHSRMCASKTRSFPFPDVTVAAPPAIPGRASRDAAQVP